MSSEQYRQRAEEIIAKGAQLPPLSATAAECLNLMRKPIDSIEMRDLERVISGDPVLAARILRIANSPYYGAVRQVSALRQAVALMGVDEAVSLINFYTLRAMGPQSVDTEVFSLEGFWTHSWAVASIARAMGRPDMLIRAIPGELYMAGLLHDIGKLAMAKAMPKEYDNALRKAKESGTALYLVEREMLGTDHAMLGRLLMDKWNLAASTLDAVGFHHEPADAPEEHRELTALIELADCLAIQWDLGDAGSPPVLDSATCWIRVNNSGPISEDETIGHIREEIETIVRERASFIAGAKDSSEARRRAPGAEPAAAQPRRPATPAHAAKPRAEAGGFWARVKRAVGL